MVGRLAKDEGVNYRLPLMFGRIIKGESSYERMNVYRVTVRGLCRPVAAAEGLREQVRMLEAEKGSGVSVRRLSSRMASVRLSR